MVEDLSVVMFRHEPRFIGWFACGTSAIKWLALVFEIFQRLQIFWRYKISYNHEWHQRKTIWDKICFVVGCIGDKVIYIYHVSLPDRWTTTQIQHHLRQSWGWSRTQVDSCTGLPCLLEIIWGSLNFNDRQTCTIQHGQKGLKEI